MTNRFRKTPATLQELQAVADAAARLLSGEYLNLEGGIKLPGGPHFHSNNVMEKIRALTEALHAAGYEWDTLT